MNAHAPTLPAAVFPWSTGRRPALGWSVSVLVHALALALIWQWAPRRPVDTGAAVRKEFVVRLVQPARPVTVAPPPTVAAPAAPAARAGRSPAPPPPPVAAIRQDAAPAAAPAPAPPSAETPAFDLAAARASARQLARGERTNLVALPGRPADIDPEAANRIGRKLERARRGDCATMNGDSVNLLANVALLAVSMAKNAVDDSGCKW